MAEEEYKAERDVEEYKAEEDVVEMGEMEEIEEVDSGCNTSRTPVIDVRIHGIMNQVPSDVSKVNLLV